MPSGPYFSTSDVRLPQTRGHWTRHGWCSSRTLGLPIFLGGATFGDIDRINTVTDRTTDASPSPSPSPSPVSICRWRCRSRCRVQCAFKSSALLLQELKLRKCKLGLFYLLHRLTFCMFVSRWWLCRHLSEPAEMTTHPFLSAHMTEWKWKWKSFQSSCPNPGTRLPDWSSNGYISQLPHCQAARGKTLNGKFDRQT